MVYPGTSSVTFHLLVGFPHHLLGNGNRLCLFFKNHPYNFKLFLNLNRITEVLRSTPITGASSLLQLHPPPICSSVISLQVFPACVFLLAEHIGFLWFHNKA